VAPCPRQDQRRKARPSAEAEVSGLSAPGGEARGRRLAQGLDLRGGDGEKAPLKTYGKPSREGRRSLSGKTADKDALLDRNGRNVFSMRGICNIMNDIRFLEIS
jgi:hypothetical protein